jgi:hypothetical protein
MKPPLVLVLVLVLACTPEPPPSAPISASPAPSASPSVPDAGASAPVPVPDAGPRDAAPDASPEEQAIVAALKSDHAALVACHRASKHVTGDMTVRVTIGVNGKVEATSIAAQPPSTVPRALEDCIVSRVRMVRVEITPVTIPVPFHFRKNEYDGPRVFYGSGPFDPGY